MCNCKHALCTCMLLICSWHCRLHYHGQQQHIMLFHIVLLTFLLVRSYFTRCLLVCLYKHVSNLMTRWKCEKFVSCLYVFNIISDKP